MTVVVKIEDNDLAMLEAYRHATITIMINTHRTTRFRYGSGVIVAEREVVLSKRRSNEYRYF